MSEHDSSIGPYLVVFAALLGLLVLTVGAAYVPLGRWAPAVAMTIAVAKATLILLFFMHLKHEDGLTRVFALSGAVWLGHLFVFLLSDYLTREAVVRATGG